MQENKFPRCVSVCVCVRLACDKLSVRPSFGPGSFLGYLGQAHTKWKFPRGMPDLSQKKGVTNHPALDFDLGLIFLAVTVLWF